MSHRTRAHQRAVLAADAQEIQAMRAREQRVLKPNGQLHPRGSVAQVQPARSRGARDANHARRARGCTNDPERALGGRGAAAILRATPCACDRLAV